jgi:hypothetical protein
MKRTEETTSRPRDAPMRVSADLREPAAPAMMSLMATATRHRPDVWIPEGI